VKPPVRCEINGRSKVPVAAGAGDTNICGGIIQLYWSSILERCLDTNDQVRQSALKVNYRQALHFLSHFILPFYNRNKFFL
jgi:hypothetical protein